MATEPSQIKATAPASKLMADYIGDRMNLDDLSSSLPTLRLLDQRGPLTQPDAASLLSMSTGACNLHFQRLEHEGLIKRVDKISSGRGRPTLIWDVDRARNGCITIVFDVPFCQATLCDFAGNTLAEKREDLSGARDQKELIKWVVTFVRSAVKKFSVDGGMVRQLYAALPGLMDQQSGEVISAVNFPLLNGLDLKGILEKKFSIPCYAGSLGPAFYFGETEEANDDRCVMLIHWDLGIGFVFGRGHQILTMSDRGCGGSPLISELGHIRIKRQGKACHCGKRGCLEAYVGGHAILKGVGDPAIRTLPELIAAVKRGHKKAVAETARAARLLGEHVSWPVQLMKVQQICVSGPFSEAAAVVVKAFSKGLSETFTSSEVKSLTPLISQHPDEKMRRGAFILAKRLYLYPDEYARLPRTPEYL